MKQILRNIEDEFEQMDEENKEYFISLFTKAIESERQNKDITYILTVALEAYLNQ